MHKTYRIIPSTRREAGSHFEWTSDDDLAGNGNSFDSFASAATASVAMDRTNPVEGGEWLVCESWDGKKFTVW